MTPRITFIKDESLQNADGRTTFGIGIGDYPVHPVDQAVGFATFANNGQANAPYFVQEAKASNGEVIYTHHGHSTQAFDPKVANDTTLTLEPIASWSGVPLADGRPSAAKTGTEGIQSGKHAGGNSDAWMVGYTPQVSTAVWVGSGDSTTPIVNDLDIGLPNAAKRPKDPKAKVNYVTVESSGKMFLNRDPVDLASLQEKIIAMRMAVVLGVSTRGARHSPQLCPQRIV